MKKIKKGTRRFLAVLIAVMMTFSMIPTIAYAAENQSSLEGTKGLSTSVGDHMYVNSTSYIQNSEKNFLTIGAETTNGSLDSVEFTDADGNALDCVSATFDADTKTVSVVLSRSVASDAKVTATFSLTQNEEGLPFLTTKTGTAGTSSNKAVNNKTNVYTTTLSSGQGTAKAYFYNSVPKTTSNVYDTYTISYTMQNNVPELNADASASAELTAGETYTLDLTMIFTDADSDELTYTVSADDAAAVETDADYSYLTKIPGTHVLKFMANDGYTIPDEQPVYTVTLEVANVETTYDVQVTAPAGITPTFYAVNCVEDGIIVRGDELSFTDGVVKVPENISRISWEAEGMLSASAAVSEGAAIELVTVNFKANMDNGSTDDAAAVTILDPDNCQISGTAADSYLLVKGQTYTYTVKLSSTYSSNYNSVTLEEQTAENGEVIVEFVRKHFTVIAPKDSVVSAGTLSTYYIYSFAEPFNTETVGDTVVYKFAPLSGSAFIRVQRQNDPDAVTYWDYKSSKADGQTITVTEDMLFMNDSNDFDAATIYHDFEEYEMDAADIYLNANEKGYMNMEKGGTYELNIFRDWMAIEGISNAKVALPDMSYKVIDFEGEKSNVVSVIPDENNSSVATITANEEGTAVILVTYDAMYSELACHGMVGTGSPTAERFSAIWPENTGVLVVSVGADETSIETNLTINEGKNANTAISKIVGDTLDAEHDDLYYTGDQGAEYSFTPESGCKVSVACAVLTDDSLTYNGFTTLNVSTDSETGEVTVSGLTEGRHIIRIEKDEAATYQVVTAKQTSYKITDAEGNAVTSDTYVKPGTELTVQFGDLYNPINKLSGIYNTNCRIYYAGEDGTEYRGNNGSSYGVYTFASDDTLHKLTITVPEDWDESTYTLNGCLQTGGFGDAAGKHRGATYATGKPVNTTAASTAAYLGSLPEITLNILTAEDEATVMENQAAVNSAKAVLEAVEWTVDMGTANDSDAVKAWIEAELAKLDLSDVKTKVTVTECIAATAGTTDDTDGTAGNFTFSVELSKGFGATNISDSMVDLKGTITATDYSEITYTVTLPSGKGYKAEAVEGSVSPAQAGSDYSFTVMISVNYGKGEDFVVKANDEILEEKDGKYTIPGIAADTVVTVTGVLKKQNTETEKVTVYLSVSDDDKFLTGKDSGEVMALKKIEVPYFDLEEYGLGAYYYNPECYTDPAGQKAGTQETADGKVTMLHLMIYATEVYYYDVDPDKAGQGYLAEEEILGTDVFTIGAGAGSMFTEKFWNMDLNLNYYVNYEYPLGAASWGSTADQILLKDDDIVTIGHFTSWNYYSDSASVFNYVKAGEDIIITIAAQSEKIDLQLLHAGSDFSGSYTTAHNPVVSEPDVYYIAADQLDTAGGDVTKWTKLGTADENGNITVDTGKLDEGNYIIALAGQYGAENTDDICSTPGGILLTVEAHKHSYSDSWKFDDAQHWKECTCGDKTETAEHSFAWVIDKNATETEAGEKHEECTVCHATRSEGTEIPVIIPEVPEKETVIRISGADRYATSFAVAEEYKAVLGVEEFDAVIVATGLNFADALSGSCIAAQKKAPILLTDEGEEASLISYVKENLTEGGKVYLLGGTGVVSQELQDELENLSYDVKRLAGKDRYITNLAILEEAGITGNEILVATGEAPYDSLSASATNQPILLVKEKLTDAQKEILEGLQEDCKIWILGGDGAVSDDIKAELEAYSKNVVRVKGKDRYETSVEIAKTFFGEDAEKVTLAYGENFPDGLCGGPLAAEIGAPVLLIKTGGTNLATAYAANAASGYVFGGTGVIADETVKAVLGEDIEIISRKYE